MNILEDFYLNGIYPQETDNIRDDSDYKNECNNLHILEEQLFASLDNNTKQIYDELKNTKIKILASEKASAFAKGFRLGGNLVLEVVKDSNPHQI